MQRFFRGGVNIFKPTKKTTRGGGGLPHSDPPEFKSFKNKRFVGLHDHVLWFKEGYEQQYYLTMKHLQYKGIGGILWNIFRYYFLGLLVPCGFYLMLKDYAHDTKSYYNGVIINSPTSPCYKNNGNTVYMMDNLRKSMLENKHSDVLGRRSAEYYNILRPAVLKPQLPTAFEKKAFKIYKNSEGGRSG